MKNNPEPIQYCHSSTSLKHFKPSVKMGSDKY